MNSSSSRSFQVLGTSPGRGLTRGVRVLLYGARGWIGGRIAKILRELQVPVLEGEARLESRQKVLDDLREALPTHVICAAGVTGRPNVDWCEDHRRETIRSNVIGTLNLADVCDLAGIHCTIIATGCIYEYDEEHQIGGKPFGETDPPNFAGSFYSETKGMVDTLLRSYPSLVLRVRMPVSDDSAPRCFISKIRRYDRVVNVPNSVTVLHELLPAGLLLALRGKTGVYNLTNPGTVSHNECLEMYRDLLDPGFTWENFSLDEQRSVVKAERSNNELSAEKLCAALPDVRILSAKEAVREALSRAQAGKSPSSYVPERVLLTGGAGFIGSHVADVLLEEFPDASLVILDKLDYCSSAANVPEKATLIRGDVRSRDLLRYLFRKHCFDTVLHFAAETHVDNSFGNSIRFTQSNVEGTHNLLECSREAGTVRRLVHVSTDEVYGENKDDGSFSEETSVLLPTNPYAATKASAEMLVRAYASSFGLPTIVTRGNNVYGPRQYPEKLVPKTIMRGLGGKKTFPVHGTGTAKRSYLYVGDVARAFAVILREGRDSETYNIGCSEEKSVLEVISDLGEIVGRQLAPRFVQDRPFNDQRYRVSTEKLEALGWAPQTAWKTGIEKTVKWYRAHRDYWRTTTTSTTGEVTEV